MKFIHAIKLIIDCAYTCIYVGYINTALFFSSLVLHYIFLFTKIYAKSMHWSVKIASKANACYTFIIKNIIVINLSADKDEVKYIDNFLSLAKQ